MGFPLFKLGSLVLMSLVIKPITRRSITFAYSHPGFNNFCHRISGRYYKTQRTFFKRLNIERKPRKITTEEAVELGSEIIGESVLIAGTVGILYYEWHQGHEESQEIHARIDYLEGKLSEFENKENNPK